MHRTLHGEIILSTLHSSLQNCAGKRQCPFGSYLSSLQSLRWSQVCLGKVWIQHGDSAYLHILLRFYQVKIIWPDKFPQYRLKNQNQVFPETVPSVKGVISQNQSSTTLAILEASAAEEAEAMGSTWRPHYTIESQRMLWTVAFSLLVFIDNQSILTSTQ